MKLGIFGDSFAGAKFEQNLDLSWVDILSETFDVTNYAVAGSSLYYSVDLLRKNYTKFDKIIFIATMPGRISMQPYKVTVDPTDPHRFKHISSLLSVDHTLPLLKKNHPKENMLIKTWEAAESYFMYLQNHDYEHYVHKLMLNDIQHLPANLLIIPAFRESFNHMNQGMSLIEIVEKENAHWGIDNYSDVLSKSYDARQCHLSKENNIILANKFADYFRTGRLQLHIDDFVNPDKDDNKYFISK